MKIVLQRVKWAKVNINNVVHSQINYGLLLYIGIDKSDNDLTVIKAVDKISRLRIFSDEFGKINLDQSQVKASLMVVSQFTIYATINGNRPGFSNQASKEHANNLYSLFIQLSKDKFCEVQSGIFNVNMEIESINDGPFTLILEY